MKKKLLLFVFLAVLINICWKCSRASIYYYKIPYANKMLTIYIPALSDTAYAYIGTHKMEARIDSFDLKIFRNDATNVPLILNKYNTDTIYYSDRWKDITLINNSGKYKRIKYDDDRFYVESTKYRGLYNMKPGYMEISIKDYAMSVACRVDSTSQFSELKRNSVVSIK